jgi:hypothetical protein
MAEIYRWSVSQSFGANYIPRVSQSW